MNLANNKITINETIDKAIRPKVIPNLIPSSSINSYLKFVFPFE